MAEKKEKRTIKLSSLYLIPIQSRDHATWRICLMMRIRTHNIYFFFVRNILFIFRHFLSFFVLLIVVVLVLSWLRCWYAFCIYLFWLDL